MGKAPDLDYTAAKKWGRYKLLFNALLSVSLTMQNRPCFFLMGLNTKSVFQNLGSGIACFMVPMSSESCEQYHNFMHIKDKK